MRWTMSNAYSTEGHLTVRRGLYEKSANFVEVWVLEYLAWHDGNAGEYDIVKLYICDANDVKGDGIPVKDRRVSATMSWSEAPENVRQEFREQAERIGNAVKQLDEDKAHTDG